jgi:hypothetical protein
MEDTRTRFPRASTLAYRELRPPQSAEEQGAPMPDEACSKALAGLAAAQTTLEKAAQDVIVPDQISSCLR